jgi:oxygen-independent coproporphyrinogen-3 oxidase
MARADELERASQLHAIFRASPYQGYVYAYPHKTAYRSLCPARPLPDVWSQESLSALFLYIHIPFCTMRCGFCNLFTTANPKPELTDAYLAALQRQAEFVRQAIPEANFVRFAIGGGTPTYLDESALRAVFEIAERVMGANLAQIPTGLETSPDTITPGKIALLKAFGVDRVSIGIQSFVEAETANAGRPQTRAEVETALALLRHARFPTLNIDLIYGLPGQTVATWLHSVEQALLFTPEELYLYPLYVRPLTGLGRSSKHWDDLRLTCYREGRALLLAQGYRQVSMRMFQRATSSEMTGPVYCCQEDGMIGLGCGARSYTRSLHYSLDYAVGPKGVKGIIADYLASDSAELSAAHHGFHLNADEQRRRDLLQSILHVTGLDVARYTKRFGTDPADDFIDLRTLAERGLLECDRASWKPTTLGLEWSDAIGPWFFSAGVRSLITQYDLK